MYTVSRKSSSSGSTRKRAGSTKLPLSVPVLFPRVTRSSSREKTSLQSSPPLLPSHPHPLIPVSKLPSSKSPSTKSPSAKSPSAKSLSAKSPDTLATKKSPGLGPVSKEKQKRFGGQWWVISMHDSDPNVHMYMYIYIHFFSPCFLPHLSQVVSLLYTKPCDRASSSLSLQMIHLSRCWCCWKCSMLSTITGQTSTRFSLHVPHCVVCSAMYVVHCMYVYIHVDVHSAYFTTSLMSHIHVHCTLHCVVCFTLLLLSCTYM